MEDVTSKNILKIIETLSNIERNESLNFKPPTFSGTGDVRHFFIKLMNYFDLAKIVNDDLRIKVLVQCLEGEALDLYLVLEKQVQKDLEAVENRFKQHFSNLSHPIVEIQGFKNE